MHRAVIAAIVACAVVTVALVLVLARAPRPAPPPSPNTTMPARAPGEVTPQAPAAAPAPDPLPAPPNQAPAPAPDEEAAPEEAPRLRLRVVDGLTGAPVRTFEVRWGHQQDQHWTRHNTTDGRFFVPVGAPEGAAVRVRARGYTETQAALDTSAHELPPHGLIDLFDVPLDKVMALAGVVVDAASGEAVEGALVTAIEGAASAELFRMKTPDGDLAAHTDTAGRFTLRTFDTGLSSFLAAWHEGYAATFVDVAEVLNEAAIEIRLTQGATVRGRLLNKGAFVDGLIPTAKMHLDLNGTTYSTFAYVSGGFFVIPRLTPGTHVLEIFDSTEEVDWGRIAVAVAEGERAEYDWDTARFGGLFVTVSDREAADVDVEFAPAAAPEQVLWAVAPDADRRCQFGYVPAGRYEVRVVAKDPGGGVRRHTQLVVEGQWREVTVGLP